MAILKDAWDLYTSLTLCDQSKKGVKIELRRWELHLSHLEQREIGSIKKNRSRSASLPSRKKGFKSTDHLPLSELAQTCPVYCKRIRA